MLTTISSLIAIPGFIRIVLFIYLITVIYIAQFHISNALYSKNAGKLSIFELIITSWLRISTSWSWVCIKGRFGEGGKHSLATGEVMHYMEVFLFLMNMISVIVHLKVLIEKALLLWSIFTDCSLVESWYTCSIPRDSIPIYSTSLIPTGSESILDFKINLII